MEIPRIAIVLLLLAASSGLAKAQTRIEETDSIATTSSAPASSVCSTDDALFSEWGRKYVYFDRDSLFLNLSEKEAAEKGISNSDYRKFSSKLREMNLFLKETVDGLQPGKKLHFPIPKNRILNPSNISDKFNIELLNEIE